MFTNIAELPRFINTVRDQRHSVNSGDFQIASIDSTCHQSYHVMNTSSSISEVDTSKSSNGAIERRSRRRRRKKRRKKMSRKEMTMRKSNI